MNTRVAPYVIDIVVTSPYYSSKHINFEDGASEQATCANTFGLEITHYKYDGWASVTKYIIRSMFNGTHYTLVIKQYFACIKVDGCYA